MEESTTREKIMKSIRNALLEKADNPFPNVDTESSVYKPMRESLDVTFAQNFTRAAGKFVYCENESDLAEKLKYIIAQHKTNSIYCYEQGLVPVLEEYEIPFSSQAGELNVVGIGISFCESLVARTGSVLVSSRQLSGRRINALSDTHIIVADTSQLVPDIRDAIGRLKEKYSNQLPSAITLITGPSRTADIEKTLVMGAHGPRDLYVLLVESE